MSVIWRVPDEGDIGREVLASNDSLERAKCETTRERLRGIVDNRFVVQTPYGEYLCRKFALVREVRK